MLVKLTWNSIGSAPGSLLYPDNAGTQLGEEEHPRLSNSVGDLHVYMHISTLSVDRSTIACIHPILGRPITNLGCQNPSVTGSSDAKLVSEVLGQLHTAWRTPRHFFVWDTLTGDNWVPHCVMARAKTACLWSSCMSTVCNVGPWPIIY